MRGWQRRSYRATPAPPMPQCARTSATGWPKSPGTSARWRPPSGGSAGRSDDRRSRERLRFAREAPGDDAVGERDEQDREQDNTRWFAQDCAHNLPVTLRLHHDRLPAIMVAPGQALLGTDMAVGS